MREHAIEIWKAGVEAVKPGPLVRQALAEPMIAEELRRARRILVLGGGKAGRAMAAATEEALAEHLGKVEGLINVPGEPDIGEPDIGEPDIGEPGASATGGPIRLHAARPAGVNHPTAEGVAGTEEILRLARHAGPEDVALCLISGGGSALLPAPAAGITLEDKQAVTKLLHACGATIHEMNAVRKHLSAFKGGRLAQAFTGRKLISLIISDVIGDPLDVIASGPTAADPTTFAYAFDVLAKFDLLASIPQAVRRHLERGRDGQLPETLKTVPANVVNQIIGSNARALEAARSKAESLGYRVLNLGSFIEGETRQVAIALCGVMRAMRAEGSPLAPPACLLCGGETTVTLGNQTAGRGGRNQEFVLAALEKLGAEGLKDVVVLSGGTDGEDGPTDAAGALADAGTCDRAARLGLSARDHLERHDAYPFFQKTGDLLITGLTQTNVMDVRVLLVGR